MKIVLLGDVHYGVRNDNPIFHENNKLFFNERLFPYMQENGIRHLVQLGDLLDRRKYVNYVTAKRLREDFLQPLVDRGIETHLIAGNHDIFYKNTNSVNALRELVDGRYPINIYDRATEVSFDDFKVLFLPWINEENRQETLELMRSTDAQVAFGHLEIRGFEMYKGSIVSHGEDPGMYDRFDIVCSGHYHHRSHNNNIHYLGSHAEFTWSDYDDPRGFHVFDTETRLLEFLENPYKMFKKVWYNDADKEFKETVDIDYSQYKDKIVKVIVTNKMNAFWFDTFIERMENAGTVELQVVEDHLNLCLEEDVDIVNEAESTVDIFKKFIDQVSIDSLDKNKLEKVIVDLYHEALSIE